MTPFCSRSNKGHTAATRLGRYLNALFDRTKRVATDSLADKSSRPLCVLADQLLSERVGRCVPALTGVPLCFNYCTCAMEISAMFQPFLKYFNHPTKEGDSKLNFKCKLCDKCYHCDKSSVTNLRNHLKVCCFFVSSSYQLLTIMLKMKDNRIYLRSSYGYILVSCDLVS